MKLDFSILCAMTKNKFANITRAYIGMQEPRWGRMADAADEGQALALACMAVK